MYVCPMSKDIVRVRGGAKFKNKIKGDKVYF